MLYYVKTGGTNTCVNAESHEDAARKAAMSGSPGICIIVSEKKIIKVNAAHEVYFLTSEVSKSRLRIVG